MSSLNSIPVILLLRIIAQGSPSTWGDFFMLYIDSSPLTPYKADSAHKALIGERATVDT